MCSFLRGCGRCTTSAGCARARLKLRVCWDENTKVGARFLPRRGSAAAVGVAGAAGAALAFSRGVRPAPVDNFAGVLAQFVMMLR